MRKLFYVILLLAIPFLSFAQYPWVPDVNGTQVSIIHSAKDTTSMKSLDVPPGTFVYLRGYSTSATAGEGFFGVQTSSTSVDQQNIFAHKNSSYRWVRMVSITSALTVTGVSNFSTVTSDTNAFTTTAEVDTVTITGAAITDKYVITPRGSSLDAQDIQFIVEPTATGFILHRPASGASGLKYTWFRVP